MKNLLIQRISKVKFKFNNSFQWVWQGRSKIYMQTGTINGLYKTQEGRLTLVTIKCHGSIFMNRQTDKGNRKGLQSYTSANAKVLV